VKGKKCSSTPGDLTDGSKKRGLEEYGKGFLYGSRDEGVLQIIPSTLGPGRNELEGREGEDLEVRSWNKIIIYPGSRGGKKNCCQKALYARTHL